MGVWYCSREDVKSALDSAETARNNARIDRAIESASRSIEGSLHRRLYPEIATRYFDWPNRSSARVWRLWLNEHTLISATTVVSGGVTIVAADYFLRPDHGPPFTHIEIDLASSAAWAAADTHQRAVAITGLFGYQDDSAVAGTVAEALDASETGVDVSDSSLIGVGTVIKVDSERMLVTGKTMLDTAQNTGGALLASNADVTVPVTTGTAYAVDEVIMVNSEKMRIDEITGNNLTVKRAWDGSVLASHLTNQDIYAPRTLTVTRGALGTTAATHLTSAAITKWEPPGTVREWCIAEATVEFLGLAAGKGRADDLADLRERAITAYGRQARVRAV